MPQDEHNAENGLVVRRKLSLRDRAASSRGLLLLGGGALAVGFIAGFVAVSVGIPLGALQSMPVMTLLAIFVGALFGLVLVGIVAAGTAIGTGKRRKLMELQKRLSEQGSQDLCTDLQTLVNGYLELKEFQVADHYSSLLLKQSALPQEQRSTKLTEPVTTIGCWASTPEYHRKPNYWLVWLFEARGSLTITAKQLQFASKRITLDIDLADIRSVDIEHHPRWLKPRTMSYLLISFLNDGTEQCIHLTPSYSEFDGITEINRNVELWSELIKAAQQRRIGARAIEKMRAQIPGVGSSSEQKV